MKNNIISVFLLILIIWGYNQSPSITQDKYDRPGTFLDVELVFENATIKEDLSFSDGIKNGVTLWGRTFGTYFIISVEEYIKGFDGRGVGSAAFWAFFGLIYIFVKYVFILVVILIVMLFYFLTIKAHITYYIGFVFSIFIIYKVTQLADNQNISSYNSKRTVEQDSNDSS